MKLSGSDRRNASYLDGVEWIATHELRAREAPSGQEFIRLASVQLLAHLFALHDQDVGYECCARRRKTDERARSSEVHS